MAKDTNGGAQAAVVVDFWVIVAAASRTQRIAPAANAAAPICGPALWHSPACRKAGLAGQYQNRAIVTPASSASRDDTSYGTCMMMVWSNLQSF
jgi:hypothetical protein